VILVDTSVWVDHLRADEADLAAALTAGHVLGHPLVTAEIALGSLRDRATVLGLLDQLPPAPVASLREVRLLIEAERLFGRGIGLIDAALLAACRLAPGTRLWTRDRRLAAAAGGAGVPLHRPAAPP
jgi:hypothetical protein